MNRLRTTSKNHTVEQLLDWIESGNLVLADFQRDFDWSDRDVRALVATLIMGWPAGSLLLIREGNSYIGCRPFVGGPDSHFEFAHAVLDGQQRLTALRQAFDPTADTIHAVPVSALFESSVEEIEDGMKSFSRAKWDQILAAGGRLGHELYVPTYAIRNETSFFGFRDFIELKAREGHGEDPSSESLTLQRAWRDHLHPLAESEFPVAFLEVAPDSPVDEGSVARIFERVNRHGQKLGAFDLVVARARRDVNLRDLWEDAQASSFPIGAWLGESGLGLDGMPLLQALSLDIKSDVRQSAILDIDPSLIASRWGEAASAADAAIRFMTERCGVIDPAWLPYRAQLVVLMGFYLRRGDLTDHASLLERWFWTRTFALAFESGANTRSVSELQLLIDASETGSLRDVPSVRLPTIKNATKRRFPAIYRGILSLIASRNPSGIAGKKILVDNRAHGLLVLPPTVAPISLFARDPDEQDDYHLRAVGMFLDDQSTQKIIRDGTASALQAAGSDFSSTQLLPAHIDIERNELFAVRLEAITEFIRESLEQQVVDEV